MARRVVSPFLVAGLVGLAALGADAGGALAGSADPVASPGAGASVAAESRAPGSGVPEPSASAEAPAAALPEPDFRDTFDRPGTWWTGTASGERTSVADGVMRTTLRKGPYSTWQWRSLEAPADRLRVEAVVAVEKGSGGGGPACGAATGKGTWLWAGINGDGEWLLGRIVDGHVQVAERGDRRLPQALGSPDPGTQPSVVTLECTMDSATGGDRAVLWIDGVEVASIVDPAVGPYGKAGLVVAGDRRGLTVTFDELAAWSHIADGEAASSSPPAALPSGTPASSPSP